MEWEEDMHLPTENEIRFADEILPGGQDEIGTQSRRNPHLRSGRGNKDPAYGRAVCGANWITQEKE